LDDEEKCDLCRNDYWDGAKHIESFKAHQGSKIVPIRVCEKCRERLEDEDGNPTARADIIYCTKCGHRKGIKVKKYKQRGRPEGWKLDPIKKAKRLGVKPLDEFIKKRK